MRLVYIEVIKIWTAQGGQVYELIEPVDGFHPSQIGNALVADYMWKQIEANYPHIMPPINPNNDQIDKLFGDQGTYRNRDVFYEIVLTDIFI